MESHHLEPEAAGRVRQFIRLLISYNDFKHAAQIASYILDEKLHEAEGSRVVLEALNCAMIVAYCRPFSGSDRKTRPKVPDLPARFLGVLNETQLKVHHVAMTDRNTVLAHSDSAAWDLRPVVLALKEHRVLVPWSTDTRAPLTRDATQTLRTAATKLMEAVFQERGELESTLTEYFETVDVEDFARAEPYPVAPEGNDCP